MGQAELTEAAVWPRQVRASGTRAIAPGHMATPSFVGTTPAQLRQNAAEER